jgi:hypothetical protein
VASPTARPGALARTRQGSPPGPSSGCPGTTHPVTVFLHDVRTHNGHPYFAKMRWTWRNNNGRTRVAYWLFGLEGGTVPNWIVR